MLRKSKQSDRAEALRRVPLFAPCTDAELREIAHQATAMSVTKDQVLCTEGHAGYEFVVLLDGSAVVSTEAGTSVAIGAGDFFGELALLDAGPRTATVTMTTDGEAIVMSSAEFRALLETVPTIAVRMLPVVGARLRALGHT